MRQREVERKVKKVLQHPNFEVKIWREDMIIRVIFHSYDYCTLDKLKELGKVLDVKDITIFPGNHYFYVDFYYND